MYQLNNVVPEPLQGQISSSQVWQTEVELDSSKRYFVYAPSGSGKTTLQHVLYGLRKDYDGRATWNNTALQGFSTDDWAALRTNEISVVFQDLRLFGQLSARENIALKNELTNFKTDAQIQVMAEALGVATIWDKQCAKMSYGQRQRVAIIRALCQPFKFLLMDEPFSHLDDGNIQKCCALITQEADAQGAGFLLASLGERYYFDYDIELNL